MTQSVMTESTLQQDETSSESARELAETVGMRVRAIRSRRGLTRKNLAHHSDVSERYLAQLEGGSANISLLLLSRIARALGVRIGAFLPAEEGSQIVYEPLQDLIGSFSAEKQYHAFLLLHHAFRTKKITNKGVALVGLRGAGKSTLGGMLAEHYQIPFVRLDEVISQLSGMDMGELISLRGQDVYRRFELQALEQTIADYPSAVVETGGSLISEPETYRVLRDYYFTVWLRAIPEDHMQRVIAQGDLRPITGNTKAMQDLKVILEEREVDYRLADYELLTSGRSIEDCSEELIRACSTFLQIQQEILEKD